jgi:hypothetical protein
MLIVHRYTLQLPGSIGAANPVDHVVPAPIIAAISCSARSRVSRATPCLFGRLGCPSLPLMLDGHKVDALRAGQREALRELVGRSWRRGAQEEWRSAVVFACGALGHKPVKPWPGSWFSRCGCARPPGWSASVRWRWTAPSWPATPPSGPIAPSSSSRLRSPRSCGRPPKPTSATSASTATPAGTSCPPRSPPRPAGFSGRGLPRSCCRPRRPPTSSATSSGSPSWRPRPGQGQAAEGAQQAPAPRRGTQARGGCQRHRPRQPLGAHAQGQPAGLNAQAVTTCERLVWAPE